jgi:TolB-like protein/DNA-binding winged helix-turn-helix (wHTH) protein/Tfp pilus assembly protein PilF
MTIPAEPILAFAGYVLDTRRRLLIGPDGASIDISSRAFDTLHYLASHPHELIEKHRLMKAVWRSSVVEENNLTQQISTLRKLLGEAAGEHRFIVTVARQGYRFVQDVQQLTSLPVPEAPPASSTNPSAMDPLGRGAERAGSRAWRARRTVAAAAAAVVLMFGAAYLLLVGGGSERTAAPDTPSIAVLPFADVSPDAGQAYFSDGLSEELLNALGKLPGLRVIGRTSSFSFKGKNQDVREIAATLGVRHVLEGSVRRDGDRLRVTAQLVDATSGSQLWAETYDRGVGDVFTIPRQVADSVADTLKIAVAPAQVAGTAGGTRNIEAYEAYLAARAVTNNGGSTEAQAAVDLLERAVELDPDFALAWAALAEAYTFAVDLPPSSISPLAAVELQQRIARAALRAFELAPDAPQTLRSAGMVSMQNRDWAEADRRLRKAVELAGPYDYDANFLYAWFLMNVGRVRDAIPYEERAVRAEPLLLRPVTFLAALYEMRGELDRAEALMLSSTHLEGNEALRTQALVMIYLARRDNSALRRLLADTDGRVSYLDDPQLALEELRQRYADATSRGAYGELIPVAIFASFLGDHALSLDALRVYGPTTQNLQGIWRPILSDVRRRPGFDELVQELGLVDYWRSGGDWGEFCEEPGSGGLICR